MVVRDKVASYGNSYANSGYGRNGGNFGAAPNRGNSGMTASRGSNAGNYGSARTAGFGRSGRNGGYDSNRPPSAQRNFDGRTGTERRKLGRESTAFVGRRLQRRRLARTVRMTRIVPGGRTMTASYAPAMRGGPSMGRGIQRVGSEGFQVGSSTECPNGDAGSFSSQALALQWAIVAAANMALAGGNRSGMGSGRIPFWECGLVCAHQRRRW